MSATILSLVPRQPESPITDEQRESSGLEAAAKFLANGDNKHWHQCSDHAKWYYRERARLTILTFIQGTNDSELTRSAMDALGSVS